MVDQLNRFAGEVTRVAREVGTEGRLGGQANVPGRGRHVEGPDRLGQFDGRQFDCASAQHRRGDDRRRPRRSVAQDHGRREGRNSGAEKHHQHDGRSAQRVRLGSHPRGPRGRHRRKTRRPGASAGRCRYLERFDRQRQLHGVELDRAGPQHRRGGDRHRRRRPVEEDHRRRARRDAAAQGNTQHDGRAAALLRRRSDPRRPRSRHRRPARRSGRGAWRRRHLEGPDRQRQPPGGESRRRRCATSPR